MVLFYYFAVAASLTSFIATVTGQVDVTSLTCNDDKTVTLAVSNADGYYVSILGCTEEQTISAGTATLSSCSLQWDTTYTVQVYSNMGVFTGSDYSEGITCSRSTDDVTVTIQPTISNLATDATVTDMVEPTVTMSLTTDSGGTTSATTVAVGTSLYLNLDLGSDFISSDGFDIRAKTITVTSAGTTVTLTGDAADGDGCQSQTYWGSVTDLGQGSLQIQFSAFMFATGTSAVNTQVYTATLEVCLGTSCAAYTCGSGRKKRTVDDDILEAVQAQGRLTVIGIPYETDDDGNNGSDVRTQTNDEVCVSKDSFYGISAFFIAGLTLSFAVTCFMFFRTRNKSMRKDERN